MRTLAMVSVASLALIGACSRGSDARPDDALKTDLALAAQAQPFQSQQFVSPAEQPLGGAGVAQRYNSTPRATQRVVRAPAPVYRAPVYRAPARRSYPSDGSNASGARYPSAPAEPVRNTQRDAAIGAGAGAIIGAVTSRDKMKGGVLGAMAGGILGGIIGHTVDVQRP